MKRSVIFVVWIFWAQNQNQSCHVTTFIEVALLSYRAKDNPWHTSLTQVFWQTYMALIQYKMTSYQYRKSHCDEQTILRPSYLQLGISFTGEMSSLYCMRALESLSSLAKLINKWQLDMSTARRRLKFRKSSRPTVATLVNIMVMNWWLASFLFHVNQPSHCSDKAISDFDLETPR